MKNNAFCKKVRIEHSDALTELLENICQENNINNYFGTISVAVNHTLEILNSEIKRAESRNILFKFEQCVGGVAITIECQEEVFGRMLADKQQMIEMSDTSAYIVNSLADKNIVLLGGRTLELNFFVDGIEPELLSSRRELIKLYFENKILKTEY